MNTETPTKYTKVKDFKNGQVMYRLDKPVEWVDYGKSGLTEFVLSSFNNDESVMRTGPETYVFACDEEGAILSYVELPGSFRGSHNHERAMRGLVGQDPYESKFVGPQKSGDEVVVVWNIIGPDINRLVTGRNHSEAADRASTITADLNIAYAAGRDAK